MSIRLLSKLSQESNILIKRLSKLSNHALCHTPLPIQHNLLYSWVHKPYEFFNLLFLESLATSGSSNMLKNEPNLKPQIALESQ